MLFSNKIRQFVETHHGYKIEMYFYQFQFSYFCAQKIFLKKVTTAMKYSKNVNKLMDGKKIVIIISFF